MKALLRILLSLSVFVAGFSHAMPAERVAMSGTTSMSDSHCAKHSIRANPGVEHKGLQIPAGHDTGTHHAKTGCCKAGSCPCPQVASVEWGGAAAVAPLARHASEFAPLRSDYRSPALERLIRPPIA